MRLPVRLAAPLLAVVLLLAALAALPHAPVAEGKRWICPPCSAPCDTLHFAAAGTCPQCGMALVEEGSAAAQPPNVRKVAILVYSGCEILDFTGPWEMFGAAGFEVYSVAATRDPITTSMGMTVVPGYTFADAPQPDVLVIPGGSIQAASGDAATLRYIKDATAHTAHTMSVCNGAFILAGTGLLDGLSATTTYHHIPRLASQYPKIKVVRDRRYVDNGQIITTAGLSAGMDGALHVIAKLMGEGTAQQVALGEEYDWQPAARFARAALADHEIPQLDIDPTGKWEMIRTEGDTRHWDIVVGGTSDLSLTDLAIKIEHMLVAGNWKKVSGTGSGASARHCSDWRFTGSDGKPWKGTLTIEAAGGAGREIKAAIAVARAG